MDKFNFISDEEFRNNLVRDYNELELCLKNQCHKSVLILVGSIIEAILIDYLIGLEIKGIKKEDLLKYDLSTAINKCNELHIITEKAKNLSHVVRDYRNLIHPGRSIRTNSIPDENDSLVSKSLLEIIIKEIGERKQESYGYTAEQLLNKIENDRTSQAVWHHFLKKINNYEKRRLLLQLIPNRYYEVINEQDPFGPYPVEELKLFRKFFFSVFNSVDDDIKKEVSQKFITILHEGNSFEVQHNITSFFTIGYFEYFNEDGKQLVKEHLIGRIKEKVTDDLYNSIRGISKYLNESELKSLANILLLKSIQTVVKEEIEPSKLLLDNEYQASSDDNKNIIIDSLDKQKDSYSYNPKIAERVQSVINYLTGDIPF